MMNFIGELKKRWLIVIGLMILCACGLGAEKYFTSSGGTHFGGDAFVQCMVRLDTERNSPIALDTKHFFLSSPMEVYKFVNVSEGDFDYDKLNGNWHGMSELDKLLWLSEHLYIETYEHNIYVFSARIEANEPHDYDYCKANLNRWLDSYVAFAQQECRAAGIGELVAIDRVELMPEPQMFTRRRIVFKYMTIGAVLGAIAGLIVIFGLASRNSDNV